MQDVTPSMVACLILGEEETALRALDGMERQLQFDRIVEMCADAQLEDKSQATFQLHKLAQRILGLGTTEFKAAVKNAIAKRREEAYSNNGDGSQSNENEAIIEELGRPFHFTPTSYSINQPYFARLWGSKRLAFYDQASETFYCYLIDKGLFAPLRENEIRRLITEDLFAEASQNGLVNIGSKITSVCQRGVIELIKSDTESCRENFFKPDSSAEPAIHVANGMVCITSAGIELRAFDPKYKSRNQIPIAYKPGATCKRFLSGFLEKVLAPEDIEMLQRYCGLILIGGNRAQKILFLLGKGGTGKGTIVRLIVLILGSNNVEQLRVNKLNERFETSRLVGKLLLNVVEAPEDFFNQPGAEVVKALCGHDMMNAEKKGINESMKFEGRFPGIVSSNEQLRVRLAGDEDAWERRILIIDFPKPREPGAEIIDNFEEVLVREESEGILNWMIEGAKKHWNELVLHKGFASTPIQKKRVDNLIARSKSIEIFVKTEIREDPAENVTVGELYDAYTRFCKTRNWPPAREQTFEIDSRRLINQHWGALRSNDIRREGKERRGYRGLTISSTPPDSDGGGTSSTPETPEPGATSTKMVNGELGLTPGGFSSTGSGVIAESISTGAESVSPAEIDHSTNGTNPDVIALDLETYGPGKFSRKGKFLKDDDALSPWKAQIRLLTWTDDSGEIHQHDLKKRSLPASTLALLSDATWVAHNAKFEMMFLARGADIVPARVFDTLTASRLLTNGMNSDEEEAEEIAVESKKKKAKKLNSLGPVLARHLDVHLAKDQGATWWGYPILTNEQIRYAYDDVRYLLPLAEKLKIALAAEGLEEVFALECQLLPVIVRMELHGFAINRATLAERLAAMTRVVAAQEQLAREALGPGHPLLGDSKGLKTWLQNLGATVDGEPLGDVAEETLMQCNHPAAVALVNFRQAKKRMDTATLLMEASSADGRVHASFNSVGPKTGRFSCSEPNIQNIDRSKGLFRDLFVPSASDRTLVVADYSNIELRIAALIANDEVMLQAFREGRDIHRGTAGAILGKAESNVTPEERQLAKAINFGFLYGQSAKGFLVYARSTFGVVLTLEEATHFRKKFFERYPGIAAWHRKAREDADFITEVRTVSGRRQLLPSQTDFWPRFQASTNTVVQGSGGDLIKLAMIKVDAALPSGAHLVCTVHDEIVCDATVAQAEEVQAIMKKAMEEAFHFYFGDAIPCPVKPGLCSNWEEKP